MVALLLATQAPLHRWNPVLQWGTHFVPSQVETPPVMVGQAMQVLPQDALLVLLSCTQVRVAAVPHPWNWDWQVMSQVFPRQTGSPFVVSRQAWHPFAVQPDA